MRINSWLTSCVERQQQQQQQRREWCRCVADSVADDEGGGRACVCMYSVLQCARTVHSLPLVLPTVRSITLSNNIYNLTFPPFDAGAPKFDTNPLAQCKIQKRDIPPNTIHRQNAPWLARPGPGCECARHSAPHLLQLAGLGSGSLLPPAAGT
jgi:hypothetical protein